MDRIPNRAAAPDATGSPKGARARGTGQSTRGGRSGGRAGGRAGDPRGGEEERRCGTVARAKRVTGGQGGEGAQARHGAAGPEARNGVAERPCLYEAVTQRIVAELEVGRVPWVQPWGRSGGADVGLPRNAASKRAYSGINVLILWGAVIAQGYPTQDWLTFNQARDAGGMVRRGERGTTVVYADRFTPKEGEGDPAVRGTDARPSATVRTGDDEPRTIAFLKRFTVFNVAQCDGLDALADNSAPLPPREIVPVGEALIRSSGVEFRIGGDKAFYAPTFDFVQVPPQPAFFHQIDYYRTALHELTHATGHATRLARDLAHGFGSKGYAREELVAELGSAFLCAALGIVPTVRHADYVGSWLAVLKEDKRAIFRAASAASKAADWLLARLAEAGDPS